MHILPKYPYSLRKNQPGNGKLRAQFPSPINQSTGDPGVAIAAGARFGHYCILAPLGFSTRGRLFEMKMDKQHWQQIETLYARRPKRHEQSRAFAPAISSGQLCRGAGNKAFMSVRSRSEAVEVSTS